MAGEVDDGLVALAELVQDLVRPDERGGMIDHDNVSGEGSRGQEASWTVSVHSRKMSAASVVPSMIRPVTVRVPPRPADSIAPHRSCTERTRVPLTSVIMSPQP